MEIGSLIRFESPAEGLDFSDPQVSLFEMGLVFIKADEVGLICGINQSYNNGIFLVEVMIGDKIIYDVDLNKTDFIEIGLRAVSC